MKVGTVASTDTFERKAAYLESELKRALKKYIPYPPKSTPVKVPFDEDAALVIRFREPVEVPYRIDVSLDPIVNYVEYHIDVYCQKPRVIRGVTIEFIGGSMVAVTYEIDQSIYSLLKRINTWELAALLTPRMLRAIENAEITSNRNVAERWFAELIETVKELRRTGDLDSIRVLDLLNTSIKDTTYTVTFFWPTNELDMVIFFLDEFNKLVDITLRSKSSFEASIIVVSGDVKRIIADSDRSVWDAKRLLVSLPDTMMSRLEKYLAEYTEAYKLAAIASRFLAV